MNRRQLGPWLAAAALVAAIAWAYWPAPVSVSATPVSRGPVQIVVEEDGVTRIRDRYTVMPPVTGYVPRLQLHVGDTVTAGQLLFSLEPLPAAALDVRARAEAQAGIARAGAAERAADKAAQAAAASAEFARKEVARLRTLTASGAIPRNQYEQAVAEADRSAATLESARSAIEVARFERESAETALRYASGARGSDQNVDVTAPIAGTVLAVYREDEGVVQAGTPMLMLGNPRSLEIVVDVLSSDAVRIRPGMRAWLDRWGGDAPLPARVRHVEPVAFTKISALGVEEQRVRVIADLDGAPETWAQLGDAYRVEAQFVLHDAPDALRVPHSCLIRNGDDWAVFVIDGGRAHLRMVQPGARGLMHTEIVDGLGDNEWVITYPDDRVGNGVRVSRQGSAQ